MNFVKHLKLNRHLQAMCTYFRNILVMGVSKYLFTGTYIYPCRQVKFNFFIFSRNKLVVGVYKNLYTGTYIFPCCQIKVLQQKQIRCGYVEMFGHWNNQFLYAAVLN